MINKYVILLICSVLVDSIYKIILKKSAEKKYDSFIREYLNVYVIVGYGMMVLSTILTIFAFKGLKIQSIRSLTDGKHLKLSLKSKNNTYVNAIGFNLGHFASEFTIGDKVDVAGNLEINSFNGVDSIQINLKDVMKSI